MIIICWSKCVVCSLAWPCYKITWSSVQIFKRNGSTKMLLCKCNFLLSESSQQCLIVTCTERKQWNSYLRQHNRFVVQVLNKQTTNNVNKFKKTQYSAKQQKPLVARATKIYSRSKFSWFKLLYCNLLHCSKVKGLLKINCVPLK